MTSYDLVIKDGLVVDGTGNQRVRTDLGICDGRIARVGRVRAEDALQVLDAAGLVVAPGFVDLHTHYDAQVFWDPYLTTSGDRYGVTSVVTGNCGFGFAPVRPEDRERSMLSMTAVEAIPTDTLRERAPVDVDDVPRVPRRDRTHTPRPQCAALRAGEPTARVRSRTPTRAKAGMRPPTPRTPRSRWLFDASAGRWCLRLVGTVPRQPGRGRRSLPAGRLRRHS